MDKLLQWSVAHQTGDQEALEKIGTPDPKMLEQLFGGPDEPTLMKQAMMVVSNPEATLENKEIAFDNFEMLIENLDNAGNIENLKLWPSVIEQLKPEVPESLRIYAASCVGTAVQNNPKSQEDFKRYDGLSKLVEIASNSGNSKELVFKALFALSSYLRNFEPAVNDFYELNGLDILKLESEMEHKAVVRILSVISAVFSVGLSEKDVEYIHNEHLIDFLVDIIRKGEHAGCVDKAMALILQLDSMNFKFSESEIKELRSAIKDIDSIKDKLSQDDYANLKKLIN